MAKTICIESGCTEPSSYWYVETNKRVNMCFGHATLAEKESGNYGRRVSKENHSHYREVFDRLRSDRGRFHWRPAY